jgi:hypothetical protein
MVYIKPNFYRFETLKADEIELGIKYTTEGMEKVLGSLDKVKGKSNEFQKEIDGANNQTQSLTTALQKLAVTGSGSLQKLLKSATEIRKAGLEKLGELVQQPKASSQAKAFYQKASAKEVTGTTADSGPQTPKKAVQSIGEASAVMKAYTDELIRQQKLEDSKAAALVKEYELLQKNLDVQTTELDKIHLEEKAYSDLLTALESIVSRKEQASAKGGDNWTQEYNAIMQNIRAKNQAMLASQQEAQEKEKAKIRHESFTAAVRAMTAEYERNTRAAQENKNATSGIGTAISSLTGLTSRLSDSFKKSFEGVKHTAVSFRIVYGTLKGIFNTFMNIYDEAAKYQEALNLYTVALGKYAEQGSKWAEKISKALYLDPTNIMQYTGALYNLVQGLGVAQDDAYVMAKTLTQLAYDMSSYLNIDPQAAYDKLQSAITGQSRAVASAGIAMQQASLQQLVYNMGLKKSVSEMTQAEKTYLRYIQILKSTTNMQGDLARTIITPENAIRVIKTQFTLLARAIGNVLIPIVMKAIPYIMALTQILQGLAQTLANALGFKIAEIDYSSLEGLEGALENVDKKAKTTAGSTKNSINRTLAAFDDLNVVENESKGGAGSGGTDPTILDDLKKQVDTYDMLAGYTDAFSKNVDAARKNLEKFADVGKVVLAGFLTLKGLKLLDSLLTFAGRIRTAWEAGTGLAGVLKNMVSLFSDGARYSKYWGETGLIPIVDGLRNMLGVGAKVVGTIGNMTGAFLSGMGIMSSWNGELGDYVIKVTEANTAIGLLTTASYLFISTGAAIATGAAGAAGAFVGLSAAIENYQNQLTYQERYDTLFDGMGISIEKITGSFEDGVSKITEYTGTLETLSGYVSTADGNVQNAYNDLENLHNMLTNGKVDDADSFIKQMDDATKNYKDTVEESKQKYIDYHNTVINNLKEHGLVTENTYKKMKEDTEKYYTWLALSQSEYADELSTLDAKLANGTITQEEYNKQLQELNNKYLGIIEPITNAAGKMSDMYYIAANGIDLKNPQELESLVNRLKASYDEGTKSLETQKQVATENYENEKQKIEELLGPLQKRIDKGEELEGKDKETYDNQMARLDTLKGEYKLTIQGIETDSETLGATYKDYLATIYGQIAEAGMTGEDSIKGSVNTIKDEMGSLADFDVSKSTDRLFTNLTDRMVQDGKTFETGALKTFGGWGISFTDEYANKLQSGMESHRAETEKMLTKDAESYKDKLKTTWNANGKASVDGMNEGINNNKYKIGESVYGMCIDADNTCRDTLGIHSPSQVFQEKGEYIVEGLVKGINNDSYKAENAIKDLSRKVQDAMSGTQLSVNISTNVEGSFNSILDKLQNFCNKWRNAVNDLMKNMKVSMNGITVKDNKINYTSMPKVNVSKFEDGGTPKSGDFFWANENGKAEYITSIGQKSVVANQDQMIQALSDAIVAGFSQFNIGNQKGDTYIYLGNDTLYKGQGRYQSRQTDRYGTSVINV